MASIMSHADWTQSDNDVLYNYGGQATMFRRSDRWHSSLALPRVPLWLCRSFCVGWGRFGANVRCVYRRLSESLYHRGSLHTHASAVIGASICGAHERG